MGLRDYMRRMFRQPGLSGRDKRAVLRHASSTEVLETRQLLTTVISEINFDPLFGDSSRDQFFELRGTPGETLGNGTYLVVVDSDTSRLGEVHTFFDLSGQQIGANGYLVVSQFENSFDVDPQATHLTSGSNGFAGLPTGVFNNDGNSGRFEFLIRSNSFFLIETGVAPTLTDDIDPGNNGTLGGAFNNWNVLDSVAVLTNDSNAVGYADIVFQWDGLGSGVNGATVVQTDRGADYVARIGNSTGSTAEDWVAGNVVEDDDDEGFFRFTHGVHGDASHIEFSGRGTNHVGSANFYGYISGSIYTDRNGNGQNDIGEEGKPGVEVFADRNGNGVLDDVTFVVEPDDYTAGEELTNVASGMTFTIANTDYLPIGFVVRPQEATVPNASTGSLVFAHEGVNFLSWIRQMRLDFDKPARSISVDAIGNSSLSATYGRIEGFNAAGESLGVVRSGPLGQDQVERITFDRADADIAYAFVLSDDQFMSSSPFGRFDNLEYTLPEESTVTDANGNYEFPLLSYGSYDIHVSDSAGLPDTGFVTHEVTFNEQFNANFGVERQVDLTVTNTDGIQEAAPGEQLEYTIVVTGDAAEDLNGVGVNSVLPAALTDIRLIDVSVTGGATTTLTNNTSLSAQLSDAVDLPAGSTVIYTVQGSVAEDFRGTISNTVGLQLPNGVVDSNLSNNTATDLTQVPEVTIEVTAVDHMLSEADGTRNLTITRRGSTQGDLVVTIGNSDDSLISVQDMVTIPNGLSSVVVETTILDDQVVDGDKEVVITVNAEVGVALDEGSLRLQIEDDETATFTIDDVTVSEADGMATFTVSVDSPLDVDVMIDVGYSDDTTVAADFDGTVDTVTFMANSTTSQTVMVPITDDNLVELTESFTASLAVNSSSVIGTRGVVVSDTATATITDNDTATFTIDDVTVSEADGTATFNVALVNPLDIDLTIDVSYAADTVVASDFDEATDSVTFAAGSTAAQTVTVAIVDDNIAELAETFTASLAVNSAANFGTRTVDVTDTATGTISDNDTATFTIDDVTVDEADGTATFVVSVDKPLDLGVLIDVSYAADSASASDFDFASETVVFMTGSTTSQSVTVAITNDDIVELTETFTASLAVNPVTEVGGRAVVVSDTAQGTITDNDIATFTIDDVAISEGDGEATFTVSVDNPLDIDVMIDVSYAEGTAVAGDFDGATDTVTFAAGSTTAQTVTVSITDDDSVELTETFTASLAVNAATDVDGRSVVVNDTATGSITDNDMADDAGNIDGDTDFDASDAFLIQLVQLAGSDAQIDQSKGTSTLSAAEIRANITAIGIGGDVDGDSDFDANDSFLIQLVKLAGSDTLIDQSKGASLLSATQIRANIDGLGGGDSGQQATASSTPRLAAVNAAPEIMPVELFTATSTSSTKTPRWQATDEPLDSIEVWNDFRSWIDAL